MDTLSCLAVKHIVVVLAFLDVLTINFLDDASCGDTGVTHGKWSTFDDLFDTQAITLVGLVDKHAKVGSLKCSSSGIVAGTSVRTIQFTQHFAQHVAEVVIIVDVRQETLIILTVAYPVDAMYRGIVELLLNLSPYVVE